MHLTTKTRYAVRTMVDLACQPKGKAIHLRDIANRQSIKPKYLDQILINLRKAGLIRSVKGPGGGYLINKSPRSIKISEIMEAVGESRILVYCLKNKKSKSCAKINFCATRPYWIELWKLIDSFFNSYTLEDICSKKFR